jgi:hypothetical protein
MLSVPILNDGASRKKKQRSHMLLMIWENK